MFKTNWRLTNTLFFGDTATATSTYIVRFHMSIIYEHRGLAICNLCIGVVNSEGNFISGILGIILALTCTRAREPGTLYPLRLLADLLRIFIFKKWIQLQLLWQQKQQHYQQSKQIQVKPFMK